MKAIILAAGRGTRLRKYTNRIPKCLLEIGGMSILERQIKTFRHCGINDIIVVKGYGSEKINYEGIRYYEDKINRYNMVYSLFCAEREIGGNLIISYADILFENQVLNKLLQFKSYDISVVVDVLWKDYFATRFDDPYLDAESLIIGPDGRILDIGEPNPTPEHIQAQYIGLIKLSEIGSNKFRELYQSAKTKYWNKPWIRGRIFQKIHMTDFLQALIDEGNSVYPIPINNGWLEFDTNRDYENVVEWYANGNLEKYYKLD